MRSFAPRMLVVPPLWILLLLWPWVLAVYVGGRRESERKARTV